jgi:5-methylcytosine-specific restriction endonuclease McrA
MATFTRICFYCQRPFEATHSLANICSPDCRARTVASRARATEPPPDRIALEPPAIDRECQWCGKPVPDPSGLKKYCGRSCRQTERGRARRARRRRAHVETVSLAVLRVRDADTCRICGKPIDFTRQAPHPQAATIDHVIALSKGGAHSYKNTQLAHWRCNMAKGAS